MLIYVDECILFLMQHISHYQSTEDRWSKHFDHKRSAVRQQRTTSWKFDWFSIEC